MLKQFERELIESSWEEVSLGVEVKLCSSPEGGRETFVLCRSQGRREEEMAILNRFISRLEAALNKLIQQAEQGKIWDRQKVERRIGRLLERYRRAAYLFDVSVEETGMGKDARLTINIHRNEERLRGQQIPVGVTSCAQTGKRKTLINYGRPTCN